MSGTVAQAALSASAHLIAAPVVLPLAATAMPEGPLNLAAKAGPSR